MNPYFSEIHRMTHEETSQQHGSIMDIFVQWKLTKHLRDLRRHPTDCNFNTYYLVFVFMPYFVKCYISSICIFKLAFNYFTVDIIFFYLTKFVNDNDK